MRTRFHLLGPLDVRVEDRPVRIGAGKQRVLLASLLLSANRVVPVGELITRLWGGEATDKSRMNLHTYLMRVRRLLREAAPDDPDGDPIETRPDGYLIAVPEDAVDLLRFQALVRQARAATEPRRVSELLGTALGLWRGEPLSDVPSEYLHREVVPALVEQRLLAVESRIDADALLGRHQELTVELRELTARHPLRERFWAQRMLALYRSGRQAEALSCYQSLRERLAEDLGIDPSPELRGLHQAVLAGEPAPEAATETEPTPVTVRARRNDLPADIPDFAGRAEEVHRLLAAASTESGTSAIVQAIDGMAGSGKTTLAVHVAHRCNERYPDLQLFLDLRGHSGEGRPVEPATALDRLLRAIGVPGDRIPEGLADRSALWRAELADRRAVLVLDNAAGAAQVRPLLPGGARCLTLVTSRRRLTDLDTTQTLSLDGLPEAAANTLFARIVGDARVAVDPGGAAEVVALCGNLPLAIRIAGARLRTRPAWSVDYLAARLRGERRRLDELVVGDRSVSAVFALSHQHLSAGHQRLFRRLGLLPGPDFDAWAAAAAGGLGLTAAGDLLEDLVDAHLLQQAAPGRYRFHDLLREHAGDLAEGLESLAERNGCRGRLLDHYLATAVRANALLNPGGPAIEPALSGPPPDGPELADYPAALAWCEAERANLTAAVAEAGRHGHDTVAWQLTNSLWHFCYLRMYHQDWIETHQVALAATRRLGDRPAEAETRKNLGIGYAGVNRIEDAEREYECALAIHTDLADERGRAAVLNNLGNLHWTGGDYERSLAYYQRGLESYRLIGHQWGEAATLTNLGSVYEMLGRFPEAKQRHEQALVMIRSTGDQRVECGVLSNLGCVLRELGRPEEALACQQQALTLSRRIGDRHRECEVHNDLGLTWAALGRPGEARTHHQAAVDNAMEIGAAEPEAHGRHGIAQTLRQADPAAADRELRRALAIYTKIGHPRAEEVRQALGTGRPAR